MNDSFKKIIGVLAVVCVIIVLWICFRGSGNISSDGGATDTVRGNIQSAQGEADKAGESIESAGESVDNAQRTTESISDSNRAISEINREIAGLIDRGESIIGEIRSGKQEDTGEA